jgi:ABC-2 type transport system ATP-binding protein
VPRLDFLTIALYPPARRTRWLAGRGAENIGTGNSVYPGVMATPPCIAVDQLVKDFGVRRRRVRALAGVDLSVGAGEVFGLLGANGAGKTTLVKLLLGLAVPTGGSVRLRGRDPRQAACRSRVGYLPEGHRFPDYLSGTAALRLLGRLAGVEEDVLARRIPELLTLVGLSERARDRVGRYSKGMTQRLGLAAALIDEPEILFLDEPTDGVDPVGRRHIRDVLLAARDRGTTIFINSHLLSEVERTCGRVAILHEGRVVREGSIEALTRPTHRYRMTLGPAAPSTLPDLQAAGVRVTSTNGSLEVEVDTLESLNRLIDRLRAERILISEVTPLRTALEDVFVSALNGGGPDPAHGDQRGATGTDESAGMGATGRREGA